jgi:hypothetical protein
MYVDILHLKDDRSLPEVANEIFPLFKIKSFEKRESSFYPKGLYFVGRDKTFDLRISVEDDIGCEEYQYALSFGYVEKEQRSRNEALRMLLSHKYEVSRPTGDDRNPTRDVYSLNPNNEIVSKTEQLDRSLAKAKV